MRAAAAELPGGGDLYMHMVSIIESALILLSETDGDLAGWLGDLAPRGDLDSAQILYRLALGNAVKAVTPKGAFLGDVYDQYVALNVTEVAMQALPMLALADRMLQPGRSCSGGSNSSSGGGARAVKAGSGRKGDSLTFTQVWSQSPAYLKVVGRAASAFEATVPCMEKVGVRSSSFFLINSHVLSVVSYKALVMSISAASCLMCPSCCRQTCHRKTVPLLTPCNCSMWLFCPPIRAGAGRPQSSC